VFEDEVFGLKTQTSDIVRDIVRLSNEFKKDHALNDSLYSIIETLLLKMEDSTTVEQYLSSINTVPITPKEIIRKEQSIDSMIESIPEKENYDIIVPVAQGGLEPAFQLAYCRSPDVLIYPILHSKKTRKHKELNIQRDTKFLEKIDGMDVVVVEDWIDSGETIIDVVEGLEEHNPASISLATIKRTPESFDMEPLRKYRIYHGFVGQYKGNK